MRRINIRLLIVLAVATAVLAVGVHLLHGFQVKRNAGVFLREAEQAKEAGQFGEAVRNLQWYVDLVPDDVEVLCEMGGLLVDMRAYQPAYFTFERVLRLDPDRTDIRRRLVTVAIAIGRHRDAKEHLDRTLLKLYPNDGELLDQLGQCEEAATQFEQAKEKYEEAIKHAPNQLPTYLRLADLLRRRLALRDDGDKCMANMVDANPDSALAHVIFGRYLLGDTEKDRSNEAMSQAIEALKLADDDADALQLAAQCATVLARRSLEQQPDSEEAKKRLETARQYADRGIKLYPRQVSFYMARADIDMLAKRRDDAIDCLREGLERNPGNTDLLWGIGKLLVDAGKTEEARAAIDRFAAAKGPQPLVQFLEARLEFSGGRWLAASHRLEGIRAELIPWPAQVKEADFWLGQCYQQLGNADLQLASYRRAVGVDPLWVPARMGVVGALISLGRIEEAVGELSQTMRMTTAPAVGWIQLAQLAILQHLRLDKAKRDWSRVEAMLDKIEEASPGNETVAILRAEVRVAQDRVADAEKLLSEAQVAKPDKLDLRLALAALAERQRDWDRGAALLNAAEKDLGDSAALRLARATFAVMKSGKEGAAAVWQLSEKADDLSAEERRKLWAGLAGILISAGDYEHARTLCRKLADAEPNNLRVWLLLFDLALRAQDASDLDHVLNEIDRIEGRGPLWQYGRAVYLLLSAKEGEDDPLREALELLTKAGLARPAWSRVPLLAGEIHDRRGNEEIAIKSYSDAFELGERSPRALRRAVYLLSMRQRFIDADKLIRRLEEQQNPFSTDLGRLASQVSLRLNEFDRALEMAREAARDSTQYTDHVWLGQVLSIFGQRLKAEKRLEEAQPMFDEAEEELRRAVELLPDATDAWVALIGFYGRTLDEKSKAEETIAEARQKISSGLAPVAAAQCYEVLGEMERAEEEYKQALVNAPSESSVARQVAEFYLRTDKPQPAEAQLRRIVEGQIKAKEEDLVWSRRGLALLLAQRRDFADLQQGLNLIDANLSRSVPAVQDRRAKAVLLASHPKRREREKAIKELEQLLKAQQLPEVADRFVLAKLYLANGDWTNGSRHMRTLLAAQGKQPQFVQTYVEALIARNEIEEAELWLTRLEKLAADRFATIVLRAQTLLLRGRHAEAIKLLNDFLQSKQDNSKDDLTRMVFVATTFNELSFRAKRLKNDPKTAPFAAEAEKQFAAEAEKLYREYVRQQPKESLLLAAFLGRQGRVKEALEIIAADWKEASLTVLSTTLLIVLQETADAPDEQQRAETVLLEALKKHEQPLGLLMILADLRSIQRRNGEAIAVYRQILERSPNNIEAMNNLALLLALEGKQLDEATQLIERTVKQAGPSAALLDSRAIVFMATGKPREALNDLADAIADAPSPTLYFHQAQAFALMGQRDPARKAWDEAEKRGLQQSSLHPLERASYEKLASLLR